MYRDSRAIQRLRVWPFVGSSTAHIIHFLSFSSGAVPNAMRTATVNACEIVTYDIIKTQIVRKSLMTDNAPCHLVAAVCAGEYSFEKLTSTT